MVTSTAQDKRKKKSGTNPARHLVDSAWRRRPPAHKLRGRVMKVTTLETVAGRMVEETLGVVRGSVLWSRGLKKFSRGGIRAMEYMTNEDVAEGLNQARLDAEEALKRQALSLGADAVVGLRFEILEMGAGMFQAAATGTAVRTSALPQAGAPAFGKRNGFDMGQPANDTAEILQFPRLRAAGGMNGRLN